MITYLRLQNFRRHADTELRFEPTDQIVIVSGDNGAGKTTIFESVLWALYGEGRNGRGNIERLIRRGGELEGMQVEIEFTVADATYRVVRRRDSQITSAVLWVNDVAQVEGPREVTAEVTAVLGMDARGFKLATYAQQKELNGLASMRPAERGQMLSRLLRLDIVARAKEAARADFRRQRDVLRELGAGEDTAELASAAAEIATELASNETALAAAREAVLAIDAEIAASAGIDAAYNAAVEHQLRIAALVQADESEVARLQSELDAIVIPEPITAPDRSLVDLQTRASEVERLIARGEERQQHHKQRGVVAHELQRCDERLDAIDELLSTLSAVDVGACEAARQAAHVACDAYVEQRDQYRADLAAAGARVMAAAQQLAQAQSLEAECLSCGQSISDEHRHSQVAAAVAGHADAVEDERGLRAALDVSNQHLASAQQQLDEATASLDAAQRQVAQGVQLGIERTELLRRRGVYLEQLERLVTSDDDLTDLYVERADLAVNLTLASQAHDRDVLRTARLERRASVLAARDQAAARLCDHQVLHAQSAVDTDLQLAHERRASQIESRSCEQEIVAELQAHVATLRERSSAVAAEIARVERARNRRSELDHQAQVAYWTGEVLEEVESHATRQIRPSLEGGVGELLARLSDGRFDAISLDDEYNITVRDDGVLRPLQDLSGGEVDLVSLAVRLALSSVVAERQGSGGVGFLILDEPIGSQDTGRRGSILTALRSLKSSHGQIFLISHVGGLEDAADAVVDVDLDDERHAVASKQ